MSKDTSARFYLPLELRQRAEVGEHNFINKVARVLESAGLEVMFEAPETADPRKGGYSLFFMRDPFVRNSVTLRRAYYYPFWHIERTNERWHWEVAETAFESRDIDEQEARKFFQAWRRRLYGDAINDVRKGSFVYVPLQGRLLEQRSFQSCSPIEMLGHVLAQEPERNVVATLHPGEIYTEQEQEVLRRLTEEYPRLKVQVGGMERLLPRCAYVVSMNSSVAFAGFFFKKPCVLFGRIDFHHIAANVHQLGVEGAFAQVREMKPPYPAYLWWFLQNMSINAGRPEADDIIRARLLRLGWPVG
ncbi:hypothetical protein NBRC116594_21470 [Shimia sp. NS0008-38b]|uniref:hypothetical protein n=1 Tax=Shimia sp. NS0008-38b TaxID=3127653 RepID=UPI003105EDE1